MAQMRDGGGFHWGCSSCTVRNEYVFWKLEPNGTNGLDMRRKRKEKEPRITTEFLVGATGWMPVPRMAT